MRSNRRNLKFRGVSLRDRFIDRCDFADFFLSNFVMFGRERVVGLPLGAIHQNKRSFFVTRLIAGAFNAFNWSFVLKMLRYVGRHGAADGHTRDVIGS